MPPRTIHTLECTRTRNEHSPPRRLRQVAVALAILALACDSSAAPARADGDPASDVLALQTLFLPQDAPVAASQQAQLSALLTAAKRRGYPIRVAIIASASDLGSVTALWHQPQTYARFLGQELSLIYRGPLLVVMPNGYGVYSLASPRAAPSALTGISLPSGSLGTATMAAIQRLAATYGHNLTLPTTTTPPTASSSDTIAWLVFALGITLILLAWIASLRAHPLRTRHTEITST